MKPWLCIGRMQASRRRFGLHPRFVTTAACVLMLATTLPACKPRVHVIPPDELPTDLYGGVAPTPTPVATATIQIYLTAGGRLVAVPRTHQPPDDVEAAVRSLLQGPTEQELARGLRTAIPPEAAVIGASVSGAVASINVSSEFELGAEEAVLALRVAQVVYTATEQPGVTRVRLLIEGEPVDVVADQGGPRSGPVGREEYGSLAPRR